MNVDKAILNRVSDKPPRYSELSKAQQQKVAQVMNFLVAGTPHSSILIAIRKDGRVETEYRVIE